METATEWIARRVAPQPWGRAEIFLGHASRRLRRARQAQRRDFDPWTAWALSLLVPGAGQLLLLRPTALVWLLADAGVLRLGHAASGARLPGVFVWQALAWLVLGLASGRQAKGNWIRPFRRSARGTIASRVIRQPLRGRAISLSLEIDAPSSAAELWRRAANLQRFLTIDPFHSRVLSAGDDWSLGAALAIEHRAFGLRWFRRGRILRWRQGEGYAFSDLSPRGNDRGFPHVFFVRVESRPGNRGRIVIAVRGRWTGRWFPARLGLLWVSWIMHGHARLLRQALR